MRICSIEGCERKHECRGFCNMHYKRYMRHGDPTVLKIDFSIAERLENNYMPIPETGCWLWTRALSSKGYGCTNINGKTEYAHREAYKHYIGHVPKGLWVLHKCDTPSCINPNHLFLGTHKDNMADMVNKGRSNTQKGEAHLDAKLTNKQAWYVYVLGKSGIQPSIIANKMRLPIVIIRRIIYGGAYVKAIKAQFTY